MYKNQERYQYPVTNGKFDFDTRMCNANSTETVKFVAIGVPGLLSGAATDVILSAGNSTVNLQACFDSTSDVQFVNYSVADSFHRGYTSPLDTISASLDPTGNFLYIMGAMPQSIGGVYLTMYTTGLAVGSSQWLDGFYSPDLQWSIQSPILVKITEAGPVGGYISGNFQAMTEQSVDNPIPHLLTCNFRVLRPQ